MSNNPTLLMTFAANNLQGVKAEADKIWKSVKKNTTIKAKKLNDATIDKLAENIIDCGKDLFMFHFGGHADQKGIVLDGFRNIDKIRLSRLLLPNEKHNVQLIFLNGCLSYGHVGILTAKGVKAIIATNVKVDDAEAVRIGAFFYKLFFEKEYTLKEAFETAEATVVGNNAFITIVNPGEVDENQPMTSSWTLFIHAQHKYVMDWKLADFLNGNQSKPIETLGITQTHSGSGDNVAGNKIGTQINMGMGNPNNDNQTAAQPPIKPMNFNESVKDLVGKGKLTDALNKIATKSDEDQIIMLKSRINRLERDVNGGTLDARDANIERNRITSAILALLDDLT